jgi:hypothetical protein
MHSSYTANVVKRLEAMADSAKLAMNEIAIIDYNYMVA